MKKIYIIPTLNVVKIQPAQFIAASLPEGKEFDRNNDVVLSRRARFSEWEEEEE